MSFASRIIAFLAVFSLLAGCGLKGPLYLPPPESEQGEAEKAATPSQPNKLKAIIREPSAPAPQTPAQPR